MIPPPSPAVRRLLLVAGERRTSGDLGAAEIAYRKAHALEPENAQALAGMGAIACRQGQPARAVEYLARACDLQHDNAGFHHHHAEALQQLGRLSQAEEALRRALAIDGGFWPALASLISILRGAHAQALAQRNILRAKAIGHELASLLNNQGNVLLRQCQFMQAVECYRHALSWRGDYAVAWSNLGNALRDLGQLSEAHYACRRAALHDPSLAPAWNNLGNVLIEQARFEEASACYEKALAIQPDFAAALHNSGSGSLFNRLYVPELNYVQLAALHRRWGSALPAPPTRRWTRLQEPDRILRVAYISADFREHAMRHFIEPLLAQHDASKVEVVCYAQGPVADGVSRRLIAYGHRWVWVHGLNDSELAAQIENDAVDILVDCAGHTHGTRITALASKPAPIMMAWLGYLCTTGLPAMDYRLTDIWVDPPTLDASPDTESLLRIPGGMLAYRAHDASPPPGPPPCLDRGYVTFGSLNNAQKLNPQIVGQWARLMQLVPDSRLLLQSKLLGDPGVAGRIRGMFEAFGIRPDRIELRPASKDFLLTYLDIDIALDTQPYGGGASTCDALWMGVPVVTLAGERPAGRLSSCILHLAGYPEWIATTRDDYVQRAAELSRDSSALTRIRAGLRPRMLASALCDERSFACRLEGVYRSAWKRWLARQ